MSEQSVLEKIASVGILPVIKIEEKDTAVDLADAIRKGGINAIEVTARNDTAFESIAKIVEAYPDMNVGAGTITDTDLVKQAIEAGAKFIVCPGFSPKVIQCCQEYAIPVVPGCSSPSEIQQAMEMGINTVKFFPSEKCGGVPMIKELSGPFFKVKFIPTSGITFDNVGSYLTCDSVAAVGGSFMAKADVIARHDWQTITDNCKRCVELALGFELAHVGINCEDKDQAVDWANDLNVRFPMGVAVGGKSTFLGKAVELMHIPYYGTHGHIGFKVNSVERAKAYFEKNGLEIIEESISYSAKGNMQFFYLKDEVGGFALHVVKK